jgi:hypothetical protein
MPVVRLANVYERTMKLFDNLYHDENLNVNRTIEMPARIQLMDELKNNV